MFAIVFKLLYFLIFS